MPFVEEVYKNGSKLFGAHTGKEYEVGQTEEKGCCRWSKPTYAMPDSIVLEVEDSDQSIPSGNGCGKK